MADDDVRTFDKDNPPDPGTGVWYRSKEMIYASGPHTDVKVNNRRQKGTGFVVDSAPVENKVGKLEWVDEDDFHEKWAVATAADPIPRPPGPHFDATEASREQAETYQFDPNVEGDEEARQRLQNPQET